MLINRQKNISEGTIALLNGRKPGSQFPCSWIRIRIPNIDPDPGQPNQSGSGSTIHWEKAYVKLGYRYG
jgi:hypothetical protein